MKIDGILEVDKWIENSSFERFDTLEALEAKVTRVGAIGYFNNLFYYRITNNTVVPIVSSTYLSTFLSTYNFGTTVINNITTNQTFLTTITNSVLNQVLNTIINNNTYLTQIFNNLITKLNFQAFSLKGIPLFFAFDVNDMSGVVPPPPLPVPIPPPSNPPPCTLPSAVLIQGNMNPIKGSRVTYTLNLTGGTNLITIFTVIGGVAVTPVENTNTVDIIWQENFNELAMIAVGVGCVQNPAVGVYDFKFFILKNP